MRQVMVWFFFAGWAAGAATAEGVEPLRLTIPAGPIQLEMVFEPWVPTDPYITERVVDVQPGPDPRTLTGLVCLVTLEPWMNDPETDRPFTDEVGNYEYLLPSGERVTDEEIDARLRKGCDISYLSTPTS